jgi:signal transduction histidine kinase
VDIDIDGVVSSIAQIEAVPTILEVICRTTGMGFAAVARVTEDRWVACGVRDEIDFGLKPGGELKVETTICNEIRQTGEPVIVDHVAMDAMFSRHPTPAMYGFQSYISVPIVLRDGSLFGTLCSIDPKPARVNTPHVIGMFKLFADLIAFHLDAHRRFSASESSLSAERHTAELREQFIAVLGHDLRNPLASIDAGVRVLQRSPLNDRDRSVLDRMQSSVGRIARMIDDIADFARGRLGAGIALERTRDQALGPTLEQVVAELRSAHPDRVIEAQIGDLAHVHCDDGRVGQMLSNLLANALTHGGPAAPVRVRAFTNDDAFELSVANNGPAIADDVAANMFMPFFRAGTRQSRGGLGLGLYIASEIAKAHGGTLAISSDAAETRFTFRMPLN